MSFYPDGADTSVTAIDAAFVATASKISDEIYTSSLHVSPWIDLNPQKPFDEKFGLRQQVLMYDRSLPTTDTDGNNQGVTWYGSVELNQTADRFDESLITGEQPLKGAPKKFAGAYGGDVGSAPKPLENDNRSYLQFSRKIKEFTLLKADITAPKIDLEQLRYATHRAQQISAMMDILTEVTQHTWENRHRNEYERISSNVVFMLEKDTKLQTKVKASSATAVDVWEGLNLTDITDITKSGANSADATPTALASNKILDRIYTRLVRTGAGKNEPYGMDQGRPVFCVVGSSEFSDNIIMEAGYREDRRNESSKVSELLAPLGVNKAHRGFFHLNDDLAPRYNIVAKKLVRVEPYITVGGVSDENPAYDDAEIEVAYVHHAKVSETQIPNPFSGAKGMDFNAKTFTGKFEWYNIQTEENPDRQVGYFRGTLASATKPIKTEYAYTLVYKRTSNTPAA